MKKLFLILLISFISIPNLLSAFGGQEHVEVKAYVANSLVKKGDKFQIYAWLSIDQYWYTYSFFQQLNSDGIGPLTTSFKLEPESSFDTVRTALVPQTLSKYDKGFDMEVHYYKGDNYFIIDAIAHEDFDFTAQEAFFAFDMQLCDTTSCLPPDLYKSRILVNQTIFSQINSESLTAINFIYTEDEYGPITQAVLKDGSNPLEMKSKESAKEKVKETVKTKTNEQIEIEAVKEKGIFSFLWFSMLMGGIALLTPCVFPMIPITVSFFTKRAEKEGSQGKGLRDALIYALGIIITFTGIGFIVAIIFGAAGISDLATNGWVNLFIAAIFIIFALNLFGAFEIQVPTGIMNKLNAKTQGSGLVSLLLMGFVFSLTSFTCTVPFVGTALISVSDGEWFYPILGMLGFSTVFAAPFFLLALFPSYLTKLPKSGGWLNNVKVVMGFIEIAAAIKFLSNADLYWAWEMIPREVFLSIWVACGLFIFLYILGVFKLPHDSDLKGVNSFRIISSVFFASITIWLFTGLFGKHLGTLDAFLPPKDYGSQGKSYSMLGESTTEKEVWFDSYEAALREAQREDKLLFIDFTGFQCTNCRWMESNMFPRQDVKTLMGKMVKVKLYTDRKVEPYISNKKFQQDRFGSIALPLYVIMSPKEDFLGSKSYTTNEVEFRKFLQDALDIHSDNIAQN